MNFFLKKILIGLFILNTFVCAESIDTENVKTKLISSAKTISPSDTFYLAVEFEMLNGWHIYWRNSGDSGLPTTIEWIVPDGFIVSKTLYPLPEILKENESATFIYEAKVLLIAAVQAPSKLDDAKYIFTAKVDWLECKKACLPGSSELSLELQSAKPEVNKENEKLINNWLKKLPIKNADWKFLAELQDDKVMLEAIRPIWYKNANFTVQFFPYDDNIFAHASEQKTTIGENGFTIELPLNKFRSDDPSKIEGILTSNHSWVENDERHSIEINKEILKKE